MANEDIGALVTWANALAQAAASAGFPMAAVPSSSDLKDFIGWAREVGATIGGMMPLPSLGEDADFGAVLGWAHALDGAARGMGAALPSLPQG